MVTGEVTSKKGAIFAVYALVFLAFVAWEFSEIMASYHSAGKVISVNLTRNTFALLDFRPPQGPTSAIIIFASGDGGWSELEENISLTLEHHGYEVIGINSNAYAETDYDLPTLQADYDRIIQKAEERYGSRRTPVILAGWSMGAAQVIAAAGGPHRPRDLAGLLLLDPCSRGRYGLRLLDRTDFLPTGPGTFAVDQFAKAMGTLRVVQWHAAEDSIDSRAWLVSLTAPHEELDFQNTGHYYTNDRANFLAQLIDSIPWILTREPHPVAVTEGKR
jgi:phosphatidylglycerol lysyltransferase